VCVSVGGSRLWERVYGQRFSRRPIFVFAIVTKDVFDRHGSLGSMSGLGKTTRSAKTEFGSDLRRSRPSEAWMCLPILLLAITFT